MKFMSFRAFEDTPFGKVWVSRSGYTGEDGFEISLPADQAEPLRARCWRMEVKPAGSARATRCGWRRACASTAMISTRRPRLSRRPAWSIGKRRRVEGGFPGADRDPGRVARWPGAPACWLTPEGRATRAKGRGNIHTQRASDRVVTSGAFSPTLGHPIAMGYVTPRTRASGTAVSFHVRGKALPGRWQTCHSSPPLRHEGKSGLAMTRPPRTRDGARISCRGQTMSETRYTKDHEYIRIVGRHRDHRHL